MLGQPVSMLIPRVVGFKLSGQLPEGTTATDLVLTITEHAAPARGRGQVRRVLRRRRRGRAAGEPRDDRQHEPGVRLHRRDLPHRRGDAALPAVDRTHRGADRAGRDVRQGAGSLARRGPRAGVLRVPRARPRHRGAVASPGRSVRRTASCSRRPRPRSGAPCATTSAATSARSATPTRRSPSRSRPRTRRRPPVATARRAPARARDDRWRRAPSRPTALVTEDGTESEIDHGAVAIAAITSCTNTSNPSVMIGAALLAKKAVERGLTRQAVGQDHPGARVARWSRTTTTRPA